MLEETYLHNTGEMLHQKRWQLSCHLFWCNVTSDFLQCTFTPSIRTNTENLGPEVIKKFMLNSAEHENFPSRKNSILDLTEPEKR